MSSIVSLEIDASPFEMTTTGSNLNVTGFANLENTIEVENIESTPISITGGQLGDEITVMGEGNALIEGLAGDDMLVSDVGNDTLLGGDGNDTIMGGAGADFIDGGEGADEFIFEASELGSDAMDQISNFEDMADMIKIMGVSDDSSVTYDETTGMVMIDGESVIDVGAGLDIEIEETDDGFELF